MPLYEYSDPETGVTVELRRPVEERDAPIVLRRSTTVPKRVSIHGMDPSPEDDFDNGIVKALYRKEQNEGSRFQCGEFSKKTLKSAWIDNK